MIKDQLFPFSVEANRIFEAGGEDPQNVMDGTPWLGWSAVGLGALLLLNNLFDFDFDWLWRFWPVALVLVGVKLIRSGSGVKNEPVSPPPPPSNAGVKEGERDEPINDD